MHRSLTFSGDLHKSTDDDATVGSDTKAAIISKFAIGFIEFLTSSVFYTFGVLFCEFVSQQHYNYDDGLWIISLFIFWWHIAGPPSRIVCEYFDDDNKIFFRCSMAIAAVVLFIGAMISGDITYYGIFGGVCSRFISEHIRYISLEKFNTNTNVFEGYSQIAKAVCLLVMPHLMLLLVSYYELFQAKFIFASLLLNIIPTALLVKYDGIEKRFPNISRYQTISRRPDAQTTELDVFISNLDYQVDTRESDQNSQSSDGDSEAEMEESFSASPNNIHNYYRNAGVSILPQIPEEEEENEDINVINSKRLSRISMKLEALNRKEEEIRKNSGGGDVQVLDLNELIQVKDKPEQIEAIEYIPNFPGENTFIQDLKAFNKTCCCCCSAYSKYVWRRRLRNVTFFFVDNFASPLLTSLQTWCFFPALISKLASTLTSVLYIALVPFVALEKSREEEAVLTTADGTFLLSYMSFSWCFFLVTLPLLLKISTKKIRAVFVVGFSVTAVSLAVLVQKQTNDTLTISCLFFGVGHGIISYTDSTVFRSFVGIRSWKSVQGTLDVFVAVAVSAGYYALYANDVKLKSIIDVLFYVNFGLFNIFGISIFFITCFKRCPCTKA